MTAGILRLIDARLRAELGVPHAIRPLESSPRSQVWLVEFDGAPTVVKHVAGGVDGPDRYDRELTALRLAARVRPRVVPEVLAADPGNRVLVLEHLGAAPPDSDGAWLVGYATALARLHAAGWPFPAGRADGDGPSGGGGPPWPAPADGGLPDWEPPSTADVQAFLALARRLDVVVPPTAPDELHRLIRRGDLTARSALLHGDPCPDNVVRTGDGVRFVDLEQACRGPGTVELAYPRIGFPTCWCVAAFPAPLLAAAEAAYRQEWLSLTSTPVAADLDAACVGWLIRGDALVERARRGGADHLARIVDGDWPWRTATARERLLHRLTVVADLVATDRTDAAGGGWAGVGALAGRMADRIHRRWPALRPLRVVLGDPVREP